MFIAGYMDKKRGYVSTFSVTPKEALKVLWGCPAQPALNYHCNRRYSERRVYCHGRFCHCGGLCPDLSLCYRSLKIKDLPSIILSSCKTTCIVIFMIGVSSIMSWVMAYTMIPTAIANAMLSLSSNKYVILLLMNVILLVVGTFMDPTPAVLIFTPIFLPICQSFGMDPVQFGIMIVFNLCIGTITPPVGVILFTGCKVVGISIEGVIKTLLPFFAAIAVVLLLVTYVPAMSMWIPSMLGLVK